MNPRAKNPATDWSWRHVLGAKSGEKEMSCQGRFEVLICWTRQPTTNASWVDLEEFCSLYPSFKLMDYLVVQEREVLCVEFSTNAADVGRK
jgi:hypothetical protein